MMRALALDVSDSGVVGVADGGQLVGPSRGYALVEGETVVVGEEAHRQARLKPRLVQSRFWERLDAEPLGRPFPDGLTSADLVHAHLEGLWKLARRGTDAVVLAVPGVHGPEALGRLVGIAQALGMPLVGLVDAALAAATAGLPGDRLLLIDLHLHRACLTELRQGRELVRERVATLDHFGVDEVNEALAARIAEAFVRQTRFDPLHAAPTEQALHDRLPAWLARLAREDSALLSLAGPEREVEIEVSRADVEEWARPFSEALGQEVGLLKRSAEPTTLLLSARAAALPGLIGRLGALRGGTIRLLPEHAAAAGALRERAALGSADGLVFVTRMTRPERAAGEGTLDGGALVRPPSPSLDQSPPTGGGRRPTHLLFGHRARLLTTEPLVVGTAPPDGARALRLEGETAGISRSHCRLFESAGAVVVEDLSTYGTFRNDERVEGRAVLAAGDRLRLGSPGIELLLVAAEEG